MIPAFPFHPPLRLGHHGHGGFLSVPAFLLATVISAPMCHWKFLWDCGICYLETPFPLSKIGLGIGMSARDRNFERAADHLKRTDRGARAGKTLIVCGSRYGSTKTIGEWIAERLGFESLVTYLKDAPSPQDFDLVILGCAIYHGRLLPEFEAYIDRHMSTLEEKKKAVFAVCLDTAGFYVKGDVHGGWQYIMPLIKKFKNPPLHAGVLHGEINPSKLTAEDSKTVARFYGRRSAPYVTKMNKEEVWDFAERILNKLGGGNKKGKSA